MILGIGIGVVIVSIIIAGIVMFKLHKKYENISSEVQTNKQEITNNYDRADEVAHDLCSYADEIKRELQSKIDKQESKHSDLKGTVDHFYVKERNAIRVDSIRVDYIRADQASLGDDSVRIDPGHSNMVWTSSKGKQIKDEEEVKINGIGTTLGKK